MLELENISKVYESGISFQALDGVNLSVADGEFVAIMGPSGSGKTTLLNVISTIDKPTSGRVTIGGEQPHALTSEKLAEFRRRKLGFVFQDYNLLETLTVRENIFVPMTLDGIAVAEMNRRLGDIAPVLGIESILNKRTFEISGGQAQRTAIARAIIHEPELLLADEPTGNLDSKTARDVMELFAAVNERFSVTILMVTHDPKAASYSQRVIVMKDGTIARADLRRERSQQEFLDRIIDALAELEQIKTEQI